jgi:hypothetical protein
MFYDSLYNIDTDNYHTRATIVHSIAEKMNVLFKGTYDADSYEPR